MPTSSSYEYPGYASRSHGCSSQDTEPPDHPTSSKWWWWQIKGAFYSCDSLLEEADYCWIFRVIVFSADACVGTQTPASDTSLSIPDKSWLHRLALQGENHLPAQEEAVTCIIFALQSKHALLFFFLKKGSQNKVLFWRTTEETPWGGGRVLPNRAKSQLPHNWFDTAAR